MAQPQAKHADGPSPTVRVMRLYKPPLQTTPCMPHMTADQIFEDKRNPLSVRECNSDFTLSQYILLPDSFGDIYLGEVFAAYISVVNGVDTSYKVSLSARLQTLNATHDLFDSRSHPGDTLGAKTLNTNESVDMVVQHPLSELGTHTLRVLVSYNDLATNEAKTLRKFYRFNVLNPLKVLATCYDLGDRFMVQSQVINATKTSISIEHVDILLASNSLTAELIKPVEPLTLNMTDADLSNAGINLAEKTMGLSSMSLLGPDESFAYAFSVSYVKCGSSGPKMDAPAGLRSIQTIGVVEVHWSAPMGEHARARSEEIRVGQKVPFPLASIPAHLGLRKPGAADSPAIVGTPQSLGSGLSADDRSNSLIVTAVSCPEKAVVGQPCVVTVRVSNYFVYPIISQLQSRSGPNDAGLVVVGVSSHNLGALDAGDSVDVKLSVLPLNGGMHALSGLVAIDLTTKNEYPAYSLCQIMVYDELLA